MLEGQSLVRVLAAVVRRDGRVLLAQRPAHKRHGQLWEFPGGKLAAGEDCLAAARRELHEELGIRVESIGATLFERQDPGSEFLIQFVEVITGVNRKHSTHTISAGWLTEGRTTPAGWLPFVRHATGASITEPTGRSGTRQLQTGSGSVKSPEAS